MRKSVIIFSVQETYIRAFDSVPLPEQCAQSVFIYLFNSYFINIQTMTYVEYILPFVAFSFDHGFGVNLQICWQLQACSSSKLLISGINELIGSRICSKYSRFVLRQLIPETSYVVSLDDTNTVK